MLLEKRAILSEVNEDGNTALSLARQGGHTAIVHLLQDEGNNNLGRSQCLNVQDRKEYIL